MSDNDGMIGSRNKLINERPPILKPQKTEAKATITDTELVPSLVKPEKRPLKNNVAKALEKEFKSKSDHDQNKKKKKIRKFQEPVVVVVVKSQKATTKTGLRLGKPSV